MAFHSFKMILRSNHVRCASVPPEEAIRTAKSPITVPTKKVRVSVRNTFISCFEEDGDGGSAALELGGLRESKLLGSLGCGYKFC